MGQLWTSVFSLGREQANLMVVQLLAALAMSSELVSQKVWLMGELVLFDVFLIWISVYAFLFKMLKSQNVDCNIDTQYTQLSGLFLPGPFFITNVWQLMVSAWAAAIQAVLSSEREVESAPKSGGGRRGKLNKVVLAYSGGLDTSVIVPWLR